MTPRIYLDWNATTPLADEARAAMSAAMDVIGNPSSVHSEGRAARARIEEAREHVAQLVNAAPANVVFTSGGTEAATTMLRSGFATIVHADIEHACIRGGAENSAAEVIKITVDADGRITEAALEAALTSRSQSVGDTLVALQSANNETGVLQDIPKLAAIARNAGAIVFCDSVQSVGKQPVDIGALGVHALAVSAHKFGGPKGVGALVYSALTCRDMQPLIQGGGQERGRRSGTENLIGIAGFGAAARVAHAKLDQAERIAHLRDTLEDGVLQSCPSATVIGKRVDRLPNTSMIALPGVRAETLVIRMDLSGIAISAGAACSSGKVGTNPVLKAIGLDPQIADSAVRISIGPDTTDNDITAFLAAWKSIAATAQPRSSQRRAA